METFEIKKSGWLLNENLRLEQNIHTFRPLREELYIDLLKLIKNKHTNINVKNKDN